MSFFIRGFFATQRTYSPRPNYRTTCRTLCLAFFVMSCGSVDESSNKNSPSNSQPDYRAEGAVCDAACVGLRKKLEIDNVARLQSNQKIQSAIAGAALGCLMVSKQGGLDGCTQGAIQGSLGNGYAGNGETQALKATESVKVRDAALVSVALNRLTVKIRIAQWSMEALARQRVARISKYDNIPKDEALAYRTDLLIAARSLQELEKTLRWVEEYRDTPRENNAISASLEAAAKRFSTTLSAFQSDFLTERKRYKKIVIAGNCSVISDQTDEEEYTPIPLPGCDPSGT